MTWLKMIFGSATSIFGGLSIGPIWPWLCVLVLLSHIGAYGYGLQRGKTIEGLAWKAKQAELLIAKQEAEKRLLAREQLRQMAIDRADELAVQKAELQKQLDDAASREIENAQIKDAVLGSRDSTFCVGPELDRVLRQQEGIPDRHPASGGTTETGACQPGVPTIPKVAE